MFTVRWGARGAVAFQDHRSVGNLFCPASPRPAVRPAQCRPDPFVVCPGFGLDKSKGLRRFSLFGKISCSTSRVCQNLLISTLFFWSKIWNIPELQERDSIKRKHHFQCGDPYNLSSRKPGHKTGGSGRHSAQRTVGRGEAGQTRLPTFWSAPKASVPLALQGTVNDCFKRFFASTNKGNLM